MGLNKATRGESGGRSFPPGQTMRELLAATPTLAAQAKTLQEEVGDLPYDDDDDDDLVLFVSRNASEGGGGGGGGGGFDFRLEFRSETEKGKEAIVEMCHKFVPDEEYEPVGGGLHSEGIVALSYESEFPGFVLYRTLQQ